jgi:hypothetical protein
MFRFTLVVVSCALTACTAIVQFDPETQPCDESGACLDHYACVSGFCKYNDGGITLDAGVDAGNCAARETKCGDGIDEDCDGMKDCADSDCAAQACNDGDLCTVGETCSASTGTCQRGTAKDCSSPSPCQTARGTCQPTTGMCVYAAQVDGTSCGSTVAARCCAGSCINTNSSVTNCGGCGIICGAAQACQSINASSCSNTEPVDTSGRCGCSASVACPNGQSCVSGFCVPVLVSHCAMNETIAMSTGCQPYCRY